MGGSIGWHELIRLDRHGICRRNGGLPDFRLRPGGIRTGNQTDILQFQRWHSAAAAPGKNRQLGQIFTGSKFQILQGDRRRPPYLRIGNAGHDRLFALKKIDPYIVNGGTIADHPVLKFADQFRVRRLIQAKGNGCINTGPIHGESDHTIIYRVGRILLPDKLRFRQRNFNGKKSGKQRHKKNCKK